MRPDAGEELRGLSQLLKVRREQKFAAQWLDDVAAGLRICSPRNRGHPQQTGSSPCGLDNLPPRFHPDPMHGLDAILGCNRSNDK
jgi:hypothetical protein